MKMFRTTLLVVVFLVLIIAIGGGWYFSNLILKPEPYAFNPAFKLQAVTQNQVTLPNARKTNRLADTEKAGTYGLWYENGYGLLGAPSISNNGVTRAFTLTAGQPPQAGDGALIDAFIYRNDPLQDHNIPFQDVTLSADDATINAWWINQNTDTAVLILHGRRQADRTESLRVLPAIVNAGYSVMASSYRNHDSSSDSADGFYHYGETEWRDVVAAVQFLAGQGIKNVVLYGFSYGGGLVLEAAEQWQTEPLLAPVSLRALILDSPMVDARSAVTQEAKNMRVPFADTLADFALRVAGLRAGIHWDTLNHIATAASLQAPTLLIAGTNDRIIPIEKIDAFAANVSAPLEYRRLAGVAHVEGWNFDPERYETWVRDFLVDVAPLPANVPADETP